MKLSSFVALASIATANAFVGPSLPFVAKSSSTSLNAEVTVALIKELRESTGAGMMDAKKALVETEGNIENAVDWLRKKGLAKAAKKAGRTAAEGIVAVVVSDDKKRASIGEENQEEDEVGISI